MSLDTPPTDPLEQARELLERSEDDPRLDELARAVGLSPSHLQRRFRARYGLSPAEYRTARKLGRLKQALREGARVTDAVYAAGFGSGSRVYEHTDRLLGMTPARYRAGGADVAVRYTTLATPLGRLLVAATARGVCAVALGGDDGVLLGELQRELPKAHIERVDEGSDDWLAAVIAHVFAQLGWSDAPAAALPPFDLRASAFQWRVWQALTRIPAGETRSYAQIATQIGAPRAARAVGRACASNRLALVVPCHRVVREDGTLGGYRWGIARKRELLARERALAQGDTTPAA